MEQKKEHYNVVVTDSKKEAGEWQSKKILN